MYQAGCHCPRCQAAEAQYRAALRRVHRAGKVPLGALVYAQDAARLVRALLIERFTRAQLAAATGRERHAVVLTPRQVVRLSTVLRVRRAYRRLLGLEVEPD